MKRLVLLLLSLALLAVPCRAEVELSFDFFHDELSPMGEWSEVDGTNAARVEEYNARVRRLQAAAADFNRRVAQYNLMIAYPDGLDEERLARRTSAPATR